MTRGAVVASGGASTLRAAAFAAGSGGRRATQALRPVAIEGVEGVMNTRPLAIFLLIALAGAVTAGCASTRSEEPDWDGLVRRPHPRLGGVWVRPDAEVVAYRSVMLDPVEVSFADPNRRSGGTRRLNARDVASIQTRLAELFREVFRTELGRGGYQLVDEPGPETLRVRAAIVDLNVTAPDTMAPGRTRTYTASSGSMTLVMELRDSISGELLARAVDTRSARSTGALSLTNRVTNTADARRAIGVWASALRRALDDLYGRAAS
jgi:hypothetical protein